MMLIYSNWNLVTEFTKWIKYKPKMYWRWATVRATTTKMLMVLYFEKREKSILNAIENMNSRQPEHEVLYQVSNWLVFWRVYTYTYERARAREFVASQTAIETTYCNSANISRYWKCICMVNLRRWINLLIFLGCNGFYFVNALVAQFLQLEKKLEIKD